MQDIALKMENITKAFPGTIALKGVHFEVRKGEVHALIGENGAGKSTLMKVLLGIYSADEGSITIGGKEIMPKSPAEAITAGISMIHQEISLVPTMSVSENIWLGQEQKFKKGGILSVKARNKATVDLLDRLGIQLSPQTLVNKLSIANMQLVELARAISLNSEIIIMDEPTSSLTNVEINLLFKIIKSLTQNGTSIVFISHKLEEIFEICDRVTVLRDGEYVVTRNCSEIDDKQLIGYMVGRQLTARFPKLEAEIKEPVLEVKNLTSTGVFRDVSFEVRAGEILGFSGLIGSGRSEIMRTVFGLDKLTSGEIVINGKTVKITAPSDAIKYGIGMLTEDRLRTGCIYQLSVMANTTLAYFTRLCNKLGLYRKSSEKKAFNEISSAISVKYSSPKERIAQLSGGNQQKVLLLRWLLTKPKVLIIDEPTRGIDVGSKSDIHLLISKLAQQGVAIILVSSELPEILGMSDRIAVVREGSIVHVCDRADATQELLMEYAFGRK